MKIKTEAGYKKSDLRGFVGVFLYKDQLSAWSKELQDSGFSGGIKDEYVLGFEGVQYVFLGFGKASEFTLGKLASRAAIFAKKCSHLKKAKVSLILPKTSFSDVDLGKNLIESINLGVYKFDKYKSKKEEFNIDELSIYLEAFTPSRIKSLNRGLEIGNLFSVAVNFARDLVNEPSNVLTPEFLADEAIKLQKNSDNIETTIFDAKKMKKMGMNASLGIASGSKLPPCFIKIEYRPKKPTCKIVLVGKGVTFDTGGLSLKPANSMETMKIDMAGGASVLGVFKVIEKLDIRANVVGLISAVENMPSGSSVKPGDVVTAYNGKTIEILNTDAEGRVTLSDSLSYAAELKPKYIVDVATLTGACMIALGENVSGVMGNNPAFVEKILNAGKLENEKSWELPLIEEYKEMLKSTVADLKNTAKRYGGAITAGLFLQEFVNDVSWVHMDIAGPSFLERDTDLISKGASGVPVKTLLRFLMDL